MVKKFWIKVCGWSFDSTQVLSLVKSLLNNCNRNEQGSWWAGKAWQPEGIRPVTHWEIFSTDIHDIFGQSICTNYSTFETCVGLWPWKNVGSKIRSGLGLGWVARLFLLFKKGIGSLAFSLLDCNFKRHVAEKILSLTWKNRYQGQIDWTKKSLANHNMGPVRL